MRQQKITRRAADKKVEVIDERSVSTQDINPETANAPVRTISFVEVGAMNHQQISILLEQLKKSYNTAKGGIHYVVPIRNGKIGTDILFEKEWLDVVNKTCEIRNGEIVLINGATNVNVIRQKV
jgi:hypothetical protein